MARCDASVVALQSAGLFGLTAIASAGVGTGGEGVSSWSIWRLLSAGRLGCLILRQRVHAVMLCYGAENAVRCDGQRSVLRWAMQCAATALAACCGIWPEMLSCGGYCRRWRCTPACRRARGASLLVARRCRCSGFSLSASRYGWLRPLSPCRVPTAGVGRWGAAAALGMPEKESMAYALGRCHASLRLGYPVSNQN